MVRISATEKSPLTWPMPAAAMVRTTLRRSSAGDFGQHHGSLVSEGRGLQGSEDLLGNKDPTQQRVQCLLPVA
jgi:hypothetical protein